MSEYSTMSLAELRAAVTGKGMDPKGLRKAELLKTLVEYDRAAAKTKATPKATATKATPKATATKATPKAKASTRKPAAAKTAVRKPAPKATAKPAPTPKPAKARNSDKSPAKAKSADVHPKAVKFADAARSAGWTAVARNAASEAGLSLVTAEKGDASIALYWRDGAYVYDMSAYVRKGRKPVKLLNASMARKIMRGELQK